MCVFHYFCFSYVYMCVHKYLNSGSRPNKSLKFKKYKPGFKCVFTSGLKIHSIDRNVILG